VLEHGGRLRVAARQYDIPLENWVDLSTGINPDVYPVPPIPPRCWNRLPEDNDGLEDAAARFYGNESLIALPGSQAAIQSLPALFPGIALACLAPIYEEHPHAWEGAGNPLFRLPTLPRLLAARTPNVLLCNPNNPTGQNFTRDDVLAAAESLRERGGWLIVDEAFADAEPENAVVELAGSARAPNLLVLRSIGKFFGLAGARVGFLFGAAEKLQPLREMLGPWPLSYPSRFVARRALEDAAWQRCARERLGAASRRLASMLAPLGEVRRTALFCSVKTPRVAEVFDRFARRAILTRRFDAHGLLRFGLPGIESEWARLADVFHDQ
jgi:cobalamin biosynthetic protein CobC